MRQVAVFVDAGYFWAQVRHVTNGGPKAGRAQVCIDYAALRDELLTQVKSQFPDSYLLRVYWYDGPGLNGVKTSAHLAIEDLDDFKLRLGTRNGYGDQKAVDGMIIADLIALAQSKSIHAALLISGDADLTPGVTAAQALGIRVHLLSMGSTQATSLFLRAEVDLKAHWADPTVQKFASAASPHPAPTSHSLQACLPPSQSVDSSGPQEDELLEIARRTLQELGYPARPLELENGMLPRHADGKLLRNAAGYFSREVTAPEKHRLRSAFRSLVKGAEREASSGQ